MKNNVRTRIEDNQEMLEIELRIRENNKIHKEKDSHIISMYDTAVLK